MTSQRLRFLASLSERLESDLVSRERNRDEDSPPLAGFEPVGPPGGDSQPSAEEVAGDEIAQAPARPGAQVEPEPAQGSEAVAPAQRGIGPLISEGDRTRPPSVPWSETGMPARLRQAIASVRRVSNEMQDVPPDHYAMRGPAHYSHDAGYRGYPSDDDAADQEPQPDDPQALLERDATPEGRRIDPGFHAAYEEPSPYDQPLQLDEDAGFRQEQRRRDDDRDLDEPPPGDDDLVSPEDEAVREESSLSLRGDAGYEEPLPDDEPSPLDEDAAYRHGRMRLDDDPAYEERSSRDAAADAHLWLENDRAGPESGPSGRDAPHGRPTLRRQPTRGYGTFAAAFAIAVALVALAGFGLGILSGGGDVGEPLARDGVRAAPTQPERLSTEQNNPPPEPEKTTELSELATERVAPAPGAAVPEPARIAAAPGRVPAGRVSTSAPPLPPPPKPLLRPSAAGAAESTNGELADAVEDAPTALLEADGAGGPFEPLFTKLPAPLYVQKRAFVHYTANAVGAAATAMHLVRHLKAEGFAAEARPVESPIPANSIRYFFESDREQAEAVRSTLEGEIPDGAALSVRDFTSHEPRPRPGVIEIWLGA